jgi:hypothetical protein
MFVPKYLRQIEWKSGRNETTDETWVEKEVWLARLFGSGPRQFQQADRESMPTLGG